MCPRCNISSQEELQDARVDKDLLHCVHGEEDGESLEQCKYLSGYYIVFAVNGRN